MTASIPPDSWFASKTVRARLVEPSGEPVDRIIQVRKNPITGRTSRITFSRVNETEAGADHLPCTAAGCPVVGPLSILPSPGAGTDAPVDP